MTGPSPRAHVVARVVRQAVKEWIADDAALRGAALAYYAIFSIAPLLVLSISVAGLLYGEQTARTEVAARLRELLGPEGASAIEGMLTRALPRDSGIVGTVVGGVTLVLGASTLFTQLCAALDQVWKAPPRPGGGLRLFLLRQGLGLVMVLVVGALLLASILLGTALSAANGLVAPWLGDLSYTYDLASFALVTALFAAVFKLLPGTKVKWREVWVGALVTAALFTLGRAGIALYLRIAGVTTAYGAAGSLVAFVVWVYWSAQIVLLGAELTQVYGRLGPDGQIRPRRPPSTTPPPPPRAG